jgi:hypothetical protein
MRTLIARFGPYIVVAILLLAGLLYFFLRPTNNSPAQPNVFYLDELTNEESVHAVTDIPPLIGKSGKPTLVKATKISCDGGKTSHIAFLEKFTPEAQEQLKKLPPESTQRIDVIRRGSLIRLPAAGSPWVLDASPQGQKIRNQNACPEGKQTTLVLPD